MNALDEDSALSILFGNTKRKRRNVDLITVAKSCEYLSRLYGSNVAVAKKVGLHSEMVRQFLSLLKLPDEIKGLISARQIDKLDVAYRISTLADAGQQSAAAKALANIESSRDVRDVVRLMKGGIAPQESAAIVMTAKPKGYHIFVMDFDDKTYRALNNEAKRLGVGAAQLAKRIVEEWLTGAGQRNQG